MAGGVAVVTGAGTGVGRAAAQALGQAGWRVVLVGRREAALRETAEGLQGSIVAPADVTNAGEVDGVFEQAVRAWGRVDLLFNNAGASLPSTLPDETAVEDWNRLVAVNLTGSFLCARAAFRQMRAQDPQGGRIINNGSVSAHAPRPGSIAYTATKHAVTGLTKSLALDGRPFAIACGQIDIGNALTEMAAAMTRGVPQADGRMAIEPTMDVSRVAEAVVFMAGLPLETNVLTMTVMATNMPFVGRG